MNVETFDAIRSRLESEHWQLITERTRLQEAPTSRVLLVEVTPYDRATERYGIPATHYASTFSTSLIDVSAESLLWGWDRVADLLAGWVPAVDGARMGRVVPFTAPRVIPPVADLPGGVQYQCTGLWELSGDRV